MKTAEEIKKQDYMTIQDLMIIIPNLKYERARLYINMVRQEMKDKNYFVPIVRPKVALTKLVLKKLGL